VLNYREHYEPVGSFHKEHSDEFNYREHSEPAGSTHSDVLKYREHFEPEGSGVTTLYRDQTRPEVPNYKEHSEISYREHYEPSGSGDPIKDSFVPSQAIVGNPYYVLGFKHQSNLGRTPRIVESLPNAEPHRWQRQVNTLPDMIKIDQPLHPSSVAIGQPSREPRTYQGFNMSPMTTANVIFPDNSIVSSKPTNPMLHDRGTDFQALTSQQLSNNGFQPQTLPPPIIKTTPPPSTVDYARTSNSPFPVTSAFASTARPAVITDVIYTPPKMPKNRRQKPFINQGRNSPNFLQFFYLFFKYLLNCF
jgi:hypothetical protein